MGNASCSNDVFNLCQFQHTRSTLKVHETLLLPLSDDINLPNIENSSNFDVVDNSTDAIDKAKSITFNINCDLNE